MILISWYEGISHVLVKFEIKTLKCFQKSGRFNGEMPFIFKMRLIFKMRAVFAFSVLITHIHIFYFGEIEFCS